MARVIKSGEAKNLSLPGRHSLEIISANQGADAVTLRLVEIAVSKPDEQPRRPHYHSGFEECIYVLSGMGTTQADSGTFALTSGDTILIPPGEHHVTHNTGTEPLQLLCFFPVAEIDSQTTNLKDDNPG